MTTTTEKTTDAVDQAINAVDQVMYYTLLVARASVETMLVGAKSATTTKNDGEARITAVDEARKKALRDAMPAEYRRKVNKIELDAKKERLAIEEEVKAQTTIIAGLKAEMKTLIVDVIKASVKHEDAGTASFVKGQDKADFPGLRALIIDHPAIKPLLTVGDPSMRHTVEK